MRSLEVLHGTNVVIPMTVCYWLQRVGQGVSCFPVGNREGEDDTQGGRERLVPLEQALVPENGSKKTVISVQFLDINRMYYSLLPNVNTKSSM